MPTDVEPLDSNKKNSEILGPTSDEATVQMDQLEQKCYWNDVEFSTGDKVKTGDNCYECSFGRWIETES